MARAAKSQQAPETPAPAFERADDSGRARHDAMWVITQQIHELTSDFSKVSTKTDRLIADVGELSKDVRDVHRSILIAKGFGLAAVVLIPICSAFIWWLIGGRLNDLRDQFIQGRPAISAPITATAGAPQTQSPEPKK